MSERWVRSRRAAAVDIGADLVLLGNDGLARTLTGDSADLARAVLAWLAEPHTLAETSAQVERLAGAPDRGAVVPQLVELLAAVGAIEAAPGSGERPAAGARGLGANVVLGISGALAATHAPALVAALLQRGHTVEVALTPTATRFASIDALAAIARREPHVSLWPRAAHAPVPHVALAEWADVVVVYPATATTIARIAAGECSDLVAAIAVTTRAPVVIAPSMNAAMLDAPATQRNLELLRGDGAAIVHGVPSVEAADHPSVRDARTCAAPSPAELAAALDTLLAAGLLARRTAAASADARAWDAAYRGAPALVPWARDECDADLAVALAEHAPSPCRVLDIGCGLGQVARHAASAGHRVVAIDVSEVALAAARARDEHAAVIWLRDDICASALVGPFDVVVDRATLHALPRERAAAWAAAVRRLAARDAVVIVKTHAEPTAATTGWTAAQLAALLPDFTIVFDHAAELPGVRDPAAIPARLVVLRRAR